MTDTQLATVRAQFVKSVSDPVIKQLLDDLLEDKVLNDGEQETVIQENRMRADQARSLIDMVRKKGPEASEKLISRLKERDRVLFDQLGLGSDPQPAQPGLGASSVTVMGDTGGRASDSSVTQTEGLGATSVAVMGDTGGRASDSSVTQTEGRG
ncbi:hypothetical protein AAFF_G00323590 [Aldrovandia affinis]|uniref:CARD domain-containing protein n=1 Tax=Aldrovandia affinis TaxID=143900 RepID=A0AAD7VZJ9_9TELE|nr:hypothetical protein AAFF_G00323590 [Aldrovandia affinis]